MEFHFSMIYEAAIWAAMVILVFITCISIELKAYTLPIDDELGMIDESLAHGNLTEAQRKVLTDRRVVLQAQRIFWVSSAPNSTRNTILGIGLGLLFFAQWGASVPSLVWFGLLCFLTFLAFMDWAHQLIPERFILVIFTLGCGLNVLPITSLSLLPAHEQSSIVLMTIAIMGAVFLISYWVTRWRTGLTFGDHLLGSGDVLLVFALSPWFGANLLWVVMIGCVIHITIKVRLGFYSKDRENESGESAAFVPGLAAGAVLFSVMPPSWLFFINLNSFLL